MSVVVAVKDGDRFCLGADAQVSGYNQKRFGKKNNKPFKIWNVLNADGAIMGGVGDLRDLQLLRYCEHLLDELSVLKGEIDTKYMVNKLASKIHEVLSNGHSIKGDAMCMNSMFILAFKDRAWVINENFSVLEVDEYDVIGSGAEVALGVLNTTSDEPVEGRITQAIQAAADNTLYVGGDIDTLHT